MADVWCSRFKSMCLFVSAASYRGPGEDEDKDSYAARIAFTGNSRILGPICIVVGALMLALGVLLCMLTRRARRRERRVGFHCPLHGDFYPVSPVQGVKMLGESRLFFCMCKIFFFFRANGWIWLLGLKFWTSFGKDFYAKKNGKMLGNK